jgi:hypothetical protein
MVHEKIKDYQVIKIMNMLYYAKNQAKNIVNELDNSNNRDYIGINKTTEIEFYIISFSQLIYILFETLKKIHKDKNKEIENIFKKGEIGCWNIFAQHVKHDNKQPTKIQNITINLSNKFKSEVIFDKETHEYKFEKNKTKISIINMEKSMNNIYSSLLKKIEKLYNS